MCNAWNHPPDCSCGWGGDTGGGSGGFSRSNTSFNLSSPLPQSSTYKATLQRTLSPELRSAETKRTSCWWCGALVYYHTNGYGDSVLFDDLGHPWQVHHCWLEHRKKQKQKSNSLDDHTRLKLAILVGVIQRMTFLPDEYSVAHEMRISVSELRNGYGDFYYVDRQTQAMIISCKFTGESSYAAPKTRPKLEILEIRRPITRTKPAPPKKKGKPAPLNKKNKKGKPKKSD